MQTFIKNNKLFILLSLIIFIGGFLRFYKLDWASGLFTHPDEYHIVVSVSQLSFPHQMHPHFFSYGTFTIYLIYLTQELINFLSTTLNLFLIGRFYSALFSTFTIFIVYKIATAFFAKKQFSLIAAFLVALTPGLIQQAHFATPESAQIFFLFSSLLFMIKFIKKNNILYLTIASISLGLSLGVKVSSIVFLLPLIIAVIIESYPKNLSFRKPVLLTRQIFKALLKFTGLTLISITVTTVTFTIVAPYVFIDYPAFKSNLEYEGGLAVGKIPVFYTRQFIDTIPVLFQLEKILSYTLGTVLLILGIGGFFLILIHLGRWRKHQAFDSSEVDCHLRGVHSATSKVFIIAFLSLFIPNAFLFAKWTRFIAPTFPFFAIFASFLLYKLYSKNKSMSKFFTITLLISAVLWTMSFFSIYINRDIRITASAWLEMHAKPGSRFLVEGGNMTDLPLAGNFQRTSLSFYDLEDDPITRERIVDAIQSSDYFLIQSRRVFYNHQRLPSLYPKTARFYDALFTGKLGFEQIKEFHQYPMLKVGIFKLEFPDEKAEETWSVFDHPAIRVFKKTKQLSQENYAKFLEN